MNKIQVQELDTIRKIRRITRENAIKAQSENNAKIIGNNILPEVVGLVALVITYIILF